MIKTYKSIKKAFPYRERLFHTLLVTLLNFLYVILSEAKNLYGFLVNNFIKKYWKY
jgi:hypothetical protein